MQNATREERSRNEGSEADSRKGSHGTQAALLIRTLPLGCVLAQTCGSAEVPLNRETTATKWAKV
jgi:hypothetical protein